MSSLKLACENSRYFAAPIRSSEVAAVFVGYTKTYIYKVWNSFTQTKFLLYHVHDIKPTIFINWIALEYSLCETEQRYQHAAAS